MLCGGSGGMSRCSVVCGQGWRFGMVWGKFLLALLKASTGCSKANYIA